MRNFIFALLICVSCYATKAQEGILTTEETNMLLTPAVKSKLGITFPVFRIYLINDTEGEHYLVLTEREYAKDDGGSLNDSIKAICLKKSGAELNIEWKINDFIVKTGHAGTPESSIWFWSKYISLRDLDGDGKSDPVIVYGSDGINGVEDGRIKILVYYLGKKCAIRHQNGVLDHDRNTSVDSEFYELPYKIKDYIMGIMDLMMENNHAIFPYGYKENMKMKKTYFDEN